jgi:anti-sigma-K factor RskA
MTAHGPDHERWADAGGAYVLHALSDQECAEYEAHAAECAACREEIATLRVAADVLPMSALPVAPPRELKRRVMAEVEREAALLAAAGAPADRPATEPRPRRTRSWLRPAAALAALAAACVVAVVLATGGGGTSVFPVRMDHAQVARGAHGELRVRDGSATLVMSGLRPPPDGRVYQVWLKRPGRAPAPTNALFMPRSDGSAATGVPTRLRDGDAVLVTSEPSGGSRAPTRAPLISASLS